MLFSSLSTVLGGFGFADYCAANTFLDKYACYKTKQTNTRIISIGWDGWSETGMATKTKHFVEPDYGLRTSEGIDLFLQALNSPYNHLLVSKQDLFQRIEMGLSIHDDSIIKSDTFNKTIHRPQLNQEFVEPENQQESRLVTIWQSFLGVDKIGIHDDFFELGGDSLLAVQLIAKTNKEFGIQISPHALINEPTIAGVSQAIENIQANLMIQAPSSLLVRLKSGKSELPSLFLIHPVGGSVYIYRDLANNFSNDHMVYGIQAKGWDGQEQALTTIEEMAECYLAIIQKQQPKGPYLLGGASLGGIIAFEIAQQLKKANETIGLLMMIDTPGPGNMPTLMPKTDVEILLYLLNIGIDSTVNVTELNKLTSGEQLQFFIDQQNKSGKQLFPDIETLKHFLNLFKLNAQAMNDYQPQIYNGKIQFFVAGEKDDYNAHHPQRAWKNITEKGIDITIVPGGNHISMNQSPNVKVIANTLDRLMSNIL